MFVDMLYKPKITQNDAKQHLHDIRSQRQKQSTLIIDECHKLRTKHKYIFDCQFNSSSNKQSILVKDKLINSEFELENDLSIVKELTEYSSESIDIFLNNQISKNRILSPRKITQQRCLSVSPVGSIDKQTNKVYEKWPDYTEISQIVGYRIEKTPSIQTSPPPVVEINQKKGKKSVKFVKAAKQIKNISSIQLNDLKNQPIDDPPVIQKLPTLNSSIQEITPKLPSFLCPSSKNYSKRMQTRQWLIRNYFSSQAIPLI